MSSIQVQHSLYKLTSERELQQQIIQAAELFGWMWFHDIDSRKNPRGLPDLILAHPSGKLIIREVKTERGRIRPEQQAWIDALRASGVDADIVRPSMLDDLLARLQHPA